MTNLLQHAKIVVDALSLGAVVSTLATWLPAWAGTTIPNDWEVSGWTFGGH